MDALWECEKEYKVLFWSSFKMIGYEKNYSLSKFFLNKNGIIS
jgi:hypothetical protein